MVADLIFVLLKPTFRYSFFSLKKNFESQTKSSLQTLFESLSEEKKNFHLENVPGKKKISELKRKLTILWFYVFCLDC